MDEIDFSKEELLRYSRHLILPEFNIEGQRKLKKSKVLVIGAGGLGCPILQYLTAAGVGTIGIVDFDVVDHSNLQRQILFCIDDIGKPKAKTAIEKLLKLNPHITFHEYNLKLNSENALEIIKDYDIITDGTDNFPTRYLVNDACVLLKKPNVHGSIFRFEGQVSVFNYQNADGTFGPNYRDIFPSPPPLGLVPNCAEAGVLGVLPGIIGSFQASEIIKIITGLGNPLAGRLFVFDALSFETRTMKIKKNPDIEPISELIDYDEFCGFSELTQREMMEVSVNDLKQEFEDIQVIDVRQLHEFEAGNIGGIAIPLNELQNRLKEISANTKTVVVCRSGVRSQKAVQQLNSSGYKNVYSLKGGLLDWVKKIDPTLTVI